MHIPPQGFLLLSGDNLPSVKRRSREASFTKTAARKFTEKSETCILGKGMVEADTINMKSHDTNSYHPTQSRHPKIQIQEKLKNHSIAKPTG